MGNMPSPYGICSDGADCDEYIYRDQPSKRRFKMDMVLRGSSRGYGFGFYRIGSFQMD